MPGLSFPIYNRTVSVYASTTNSGRCPVVALFNWPIEGCYKLVRDCRNLPIQSINLCSLSLRNGTKHDRFDSD